MSRREPQSDCFDLAFQAGYPLAELAELALEDYARTLTEARGSEAVRRTDDPAMVSGVHVCGLRMPFTQAMVTDMEDFARDLALRPAAKPGWS